jgi:hypothetical protein
MMFCPRCGEQHLKKTIKFCSTCGYALKLVSEVLAQLDASRALSAPDEPKRFLTLGNRGAFILIWTIFLTVIGNLTRELLTQKLMIYEKLKRLIPQSRNEPAQICIPLMGAWMLSDTKEQIQPRSVTETTSDF